MSDDGRSAVAKRVKHYPNCENAKSRTCCCAWCGGTRHGWLGALKMSASGGIGLDEWRADVERRLSSERAKWQPRRSRRPTFPHKSAAVDLGRIELLSLLDQSESPGSVFSPASPLVDRPENSAADDSSPGLESGDSLPTNEQSLSAVSVGLEPWSVSEASTDFDPIVDRALVKILGEHLHCAVLPELLDADPERRRRPEGSLERALADHFWCELLAQISRVLAQGIRCADAAADQVAVRIDESRAGDKRTPVQRVLIQIAVRHVWRHALQIVPGADPVTVLPAMQLLAILMCKAPERHRSVAAYCLDPLTGRMQRAARRYLVEALTQEWMPETAQRLDIR